MSKKKATKKARPASAARRKATTSRPSPARSKPAAGRKPAAAGQPEKVRLKPILALIENAIAQLKRLSAAESTDLAIKQLEIARMAVSDVCDPNIPGGCGPNMEFPPDPPLMSKG